VLHGLICAGKLPAMPIFVDSPLSVNATEIYRLHPECFKKTIFDSLCNDESPFGMANLTYIREAVHSKKLNDLKEPAIIISASGMCEGGRIRHHLQNHIGDPENLILFIGYCAEGTLGSLIVAGKNPVNIFGEPHAVRAKVVSLDTYSGHADKNELKQYVQKVSGNLKKIICIHGEESQCLAHAETLRAMKPKAEVIVPEYKQVVEI
jgi:metallo-beta-lactamase family protein